jgi:hypothetical protein
MRRAMGPSAGEKKKGKGDFANVRGVAHIHLTENGETDTLELLP